MPSSHLSQSRVIQAITSNKYDFAATLRISFDRFVESHGYKGVAINPRTADIALTSWIDDLDTYSAYHNNLEPDKCKLSSFLMFWLTKTKPVYLPLGRFSGTERFHKDLLVDKYDCVNEIFAFEVGLCLIGIDILQVPDENARDFIYMLYYREVNPKHLFLTLKLLRCSIA